MVGRVRFGSEKLTRVHLWFNIEARHIEIVISNHRNLAWELRCVLVLSCMVFRCVCPYRCYDLPVFLRVGACSDSVLIIYTLYC